MRYSSVLTPAVALTLSLTGVAAAHTYLISPNGGEELASGTTVTIEWENTIQHATIDWDLWYSTESAEGPWIAIALDLPAGDDPTGAILTHDWNIPSDLEDDTVWVRVRQDNKGNDYEDASDAPFQVTATPQCNGDMNGSDAVDFDDLAILLASWGTCPAPCPADMVPNGAVDFDDLAVVLAQWGSCPGA